MSRPDAAGPAAGDEPDPTPRVVFLDALRAARTVGVACRQAGFTRRYAMGLREADAVFRTDWDEAVLDGNDYLEDMARRAALGEAPPPPAGEDGKSAPTRTYDPALLRFLLKGVKPEIYGAHPRSTITEARDTIWTDEDPPVVGRGRDE